MMFELQGDEGDEERVKMNLILAAQQQGKLKITKTGKEIRFQGMVEFKGLKLCKHNLNNNCPLCKEEDLKDE